MKIKKMTLLTMTFVIFSISLLLCASLKKPEIMGDGFEYLGMTVSYSNHLTPEQTTEDSKIKQEISKQNNIIITDKGLFNGYYKANNGKMYSLHFWFYSFLCTPVFLLLKFLHANTLNFFLITNALLIIVALYRTIYAEGANPKIRLWMSSMLLASPVWFYLSWSHPEVFSFIFVYIGLFELHLGRKKTAILITAIASLQNPAIALIPAYILISELIKDHKITLNLIKMTLLSTIVFLPYLWYYWHFRVFSIIAKASGGPVSLNNTIDLFFDPNMGIFFYIPILMIALLYRIFKNDRLTQIWTTILILMGLVCSVQNNWNSGMNFINRYGFWMIPIFFYILINFINGLNIKKYIVFSGIAWVTTLSITVYCIVSPFSYIEFSPVAKFIMLKAPELYNPPFEVFIERSVGSEYYKINEILPLSFKDSNGNVRKSLIYNNGELQYLNGTINFNSESAHK